MYAWLTPEYQAAEVEERRLRDSHPDVGQLSVTCRRGWLPLVSRFLDEAKAALPEGVGLEAIHAREKWGMLYLSYLTGPGASGGYRALSETEARIEQESLHVCEVCGAYGSLRRPGGWFMTRCDGHAYGVEPWQEGDDG